MKLLPIDPLLIINEQDAICVINNTNEQRKKHGLKPIEEEDGDGIFSIVTTFVSTGDDDVEVFKALVVSKDFLASSIQEPIRYMLIGKAAAELVKNYCELTRTELAIDDLLMNSCYIMGILYQQYYKAKEDFNRKRH